VRTNPLSAAGGRDELPGRARAARGYVRPVTNVQRRRTAGVPSAARTAAVTMTVYRVRGASRQIGSITTVEPEIR
jgi:hypothetical protein